MRDALLEVRGLAKHYPLRRGAFGRASGVVRAVDGLSFSIGRGETLALVGESGCGKTTAARALLRLVEPSAGEALWRREEGSEPVDLLRLRPAELRRARRDLQIVFQDPYASLNPRMPVGEIVGETLLAQRLGNGAARRARVAECLERVGLPAGAARRYPHEFSGGERQRIGIARALAPSPRLLVLDEATSSLDVSIQAQILNLLLELRAEERLSYLFIAHDLSVVRHLADRVAVMFLGRIVETGTREEIFERPAHPYTRILLDSAPVPDPRRRRERAPLRGEPPSPLDPPSGCHFRTRCPLAEPRCAESYPATRALGATHRAACLLVEEPGRPIP